MINIDFRITYNEAIKELKDNNIVQNLADEKLFFQLFANIQTTFFQLVDIGNNFQKSPTDESLKSMKKIYKELNDKCSALQTKTAQSSETLFYLSHEVKRLESTIKASEKLLNEQYKALLRFECLKKPKKTPENIEIENVNANIYNHKPQFSLNNSAFYQPSKQKKQVTFKLPTDSPTTSNESNEPNESMEIVSCGR